MWNRMLMVASAILFLAGFGFSAAAQTRIPKAGTYSMPSGLIANGQLMELGKEHLHWYGGFKGAGQNPGGAFMKLHAWDCSGANDIVNGTASLAGYCRVTDQDGDAAFVRYSGRSAAGGPSTGRGDWIGGTGKYSGIRGGHTYTCHGVGPAEFACIVDGKYELP
jgi:hypothetical protein